MNKSDVTLDRFIYKGNALAEQSRAEQSRAEQSRVGANCALFASCDYEALETEYYIRDG